MAQIKPFRALRFTSQAGEIRTLVSPPYDIVSEKERARLLEQNPYNIIRLELPRGGDTPYADAAAYLQKWQEEGILAQDQTDSLYLYEEEFCDKPCPRPKPTASI